MNAEIRIEAMVAGLLETSVPLDHGVPLFDMGADSLVFVELSHRIKEEFGVLISVQQLFVDIVTIGAIARWVDENRPTSVVSGVELPAVLAPPTADASAVVAKVEAMVAGLLETSVPLDHGVPLFDMGADSLVFVELSHRIKEEFGVLISVQQLFVDIVTIGAIARWVDENRPTSVVSGVELPAVLAPPTADASAVVAKVEAMVAGLLETSVPLDHGVPLFDMGADSLVFVELSHRIKEEFGVLISVQQLFVDIVTIGAIARWVDENRPDAGTVTGSDARTDVAPEPATLAAPVGGSRPEVAPAPAPPFHEVTAASARLSTTFEEVLCNNRRIAERGGDEREQAYPVWVDRSEGAYLWDVDNRRLTDLAMGYGAHLFGHNPDAVMEALRAQLHRGIHLGAEVEQTGRLAELIRSTTGAERVNFCVTGTEAAFTAMRLARAFTGRSKVVLLKDAYHGHSDSTLYGPRPGMRAARAATPSIPGVTPSGADDVLVARLDDSGAVQFLRDNREQIAAVMIEPLQNQNPDRDLHDLAHELRAVTTEIGALLIFDEILTGFRFAAGGFQEIFGIRADIVLYGKVVAAGLPLAVVAGRADVMDLVDGGPWTRPLRADEARLTFTAGTYAKHPLSTAAGVAVLQALKASDANTLRQLNSRGDEMRERIAGVLADVPIDLRVIGRGSFFRFTRTGTSSFAYSGASFHAFRRALIAEGVYIAESGNCFLSTAHSSTDVDEVVAAVARAAETVRGPEPSTPMTADAGTRLPDVSIAFFGVTPEAGQADAYEHIVGVAEFADTLGLSAVWLPERHFDRFAGFSPNPAVLGAMLAVRTERIGIRAGSTVLPLHSAASVAEDWAMVDVASRGRVGLALASGWMRRDFVLSEGAYEARRDLMEQRAGELTALWSGQETLLTGPGGESSRVRLFPQPVTRTLPLWQATLGSPESFHQAGAAGRGVLTNLIQQDLPTLAANIGRYKQGRADAGLDPETGHVTVLLHTSLDSGPEESESTRRDLVHYMSETFRATHPDPTALDVSGLDDRMQSAADRLLGGLSLVGTVADWRRQRAVLGAMGVDEVSCLVDFVGDVQRWRETVTALGALVGEPQASNVLPGGSRPVVKDAAPLPAPATPHDPTPSFDLARSALEIWAATKLSPGARSAYLIRRTFSVQGHCDVGRLRDALLRVVSAQADLRLRVLDDGRAIVEPMSDDLRRRYFVLLDGVAADANEFWSATEHALAVDPVDAESGRGVTLFAQRIDGGWLVSFVASHVVLDGARFSRLVGDVFAAYDGVRVDVVDEADLRARSLPEASVETRDLEHWHRVVEDVAPDALLTADFLGEERAGRRFHLSLPADWLQAQALSARRHRVTPFIEAFGAASEILDDLLDGPQLYAFPVAPTPLSGVGSQARMVPVWTGGLPAVGRLDELRAVTFEALGHASVTFRQIFEQRRRTAGARTAMIPTVSFSWDSFEGLSLGSARIDEVAAGTETVRFPVAVTLTSGPGTHVGLTVEIAEQLATGSAADQIADAFFERFQTRYRPPSTGPAPEPLDAVSQVGPDSLDGVSQVGATLARMMSAARRGEVTGGAGPVGQDQVQAELLVAKARASAYAVHRRGCADAGRVTTRLGTPTDIVLATVVIGALGLIDRLDAVEGTGTRPDGPVLEIRGSATGVESRDGVEVVGLSAWIAVPDTFDVEQASITPAQLVELMADLAREAGVPLAQVVDVVEALTAPGLKTAAEDLAVGAASLTERVRDQWTMVLGDDDFTDDDDFFELGGDSIGAIRLVGALNRLLGREESVSLIFSHPTVRELVERLGSSKLAGHNLSEGIVHV